MLSLTRNEQDQPEPLILEIPKGWPKPEKNLFEKNPLTEQGFQLGKKLFYDSRLSKNGEISCASCHQQFAGFVTFDHDLSHGVNDGFTTRNAPGLVNLAWMQEMHWDGAINHLEVQPLAPLTAPNEMGENLDSVMLKLKKDPEYKRMFKAAFGNTGISSEGMLKALAQFTGSLISANSKYDKMMRGEVQFTEYEKRGYAIFKANCSGCHREPLFTDNSYRNNGLDEVFVDSGRFFITNINSDMGKFKVPSLRNVELTYPYMHDGRFETLENVLNHYSTGIKQSATLDLSISNGISLSNTEKSKLIAFLKTLTDREFIKDERFKE
jgi:cytochrome c peroxidase